MKSAKNTIVAGLPPINQLKAIVKSHAIIDAIVNPIPEFRSFTYDPNWSTDEEFASLKYKDGKGYHILFNKEGALITAYGKYSIEDSWDQLDNRIKAVLELVIGRKNIIEQLEKLVNSVVENIPESFTNFVKFEHEENSAASISIWYKNENQRWELSGQNELFTKWLNHSFSYLNILNPSLINFERWLTRNYFEYQNGFPAGIVEQIYNGAPVNFKLIKQINPDYDMLDLIVNDIDEIGYPHFV